MRVKAHTTKTFQIYSASAGSGKTYELTKNYLSLLLNSRSHQRYRELLAITFTNKAVSEMKERILDNLYGFGLEEIPDKNKSLFDELLNELSLEPNELRQKSKKVLKDLLHNYAFFEISTIDRFNHKLIRTFAQDLKIAQNFEVVLDIDVLLEEAIARLLSDAGTDKQLTQVLMDFTYDKIDEDKSWNIAHDLSEIGKLIFQENNYQHLEGFKEKELHDFARLKAKLQTTIGTLQSNAQSLAENALVTIASNGLEYTDFTRSSFPKFLLSCKEGKLNSDFSANWKQEFADHPLYNKSAPESIKKILDDLHLEFTGVFSQLKSYILRISFLKNALNNLNPLSLLNEIAKKVNEIKIEHNLLPIAEFNTIISEEIKNQPIPFIYERLGEKYRHYFIDEFQDTSLMQWQNLIPLIGNALEGEDESGDKGSLFLVGDVKQAIYRWRGGRAEQFLNLLNLASNPFSVAADSASMTSNWRSHAEIVNFNNGFFGFVAQKLQNEAYGQLYAEGSVQNIQKKESGYVELMFVENEKDAEDDPNCEYTFNVLEIVLQKGYSHSDICILVRKNKYGVILANYLAEKNIPVVSSESLLLNENKEVLFLVNFLRHIQAPDDQNAFYQVLKYLAPEDHHHQFVSKYVNAPRIFYSDFEIDFINLQERSCYTIIELLVAKFSLLGYSDVFIHEFMDVVFEIENKHGLGIYEVLRHWETNCHKLSISASENIDAVKIMTVHKAKGLEFPIVIFPYADSKLIESRNKKLWIDTEKENFEGFDNLLFDYNKRLEEIEGPAKETFRREQENLELDAINVLYVALTRAVSGLFVVIEKPSGKSTSENSSYSMLFVDYLKHLQLWNDSKSCYQFGSLQGSTTQRVESVIPEELLSNTSSISQLNRFTSVVSSSYQDDVILLGTLFHDFMSKIKTADDVQEALQEMKSINNISLKEETFLKASCQKIMNNPDTGDYYRGAGDIYNEKDILHPSLGVLRPDRMVINQNKVTLIDYKTGQKSPKDRNQIQQYGSILSEMGFEVEKCILIYVSEENIEPIII